MNDMFYNCRNLKEINLSKFKVDKVQNVSWMFCKCLSLGYLNIANFNSKKIKDLNFMVEGINHHCNIICKDRILLTKILNY